MDAVSIFIVLIALILVACLAMMSRRMQKSACAQYTAAPQVYYGRGEHEVEGAGMARLMINSVDYLGALNGSKTVELRQRISPYNKLRVDEVILVVRSRSSDPTDEAEAKKLEPPGGEYKFKAKITKIAKYDTIELALDEMMSVAYPKLNKSGVSTAVAKYKSFLSKKDDIQGTGPVLAITFEKMKYDASIFEPSMFKTEPKSEPKSKSESESESKPKSKPKSKTLGKGENAIDNVFGGDGSDSDSNSDSDSDSDSSDGE